jgi:hypothetical protein
MSEKEAFIRKYGTHTAGIIVGQLTLNGRAGTLPHTDQVLAAEELIEDLIHLCEELAAAERAR